MKRNNLPGEKQLLMFHKRNLRNVDGNRGCHPEATQLIVTMWFCVANQKMHSWHEKILTMNMQTEKVREEVFRARLDGANTFKISHTKRDPHLHLGPAFWSHHLQER